MNIRAYNPKDLEQVWLIHKAQNLGYKFPDLENPLFFIRIVGEHEGQIVQAAFAHLTAEIYFMLRPNVGTPQERHLWFIAMQDVGRELAWMPGGLEDLHAFLPPQIERSFAKRLKAHGWEKISWPGYVIEVNNNGPRPSTSR